MYHGGFIWDFIDQAIMVKDPVTGLKFSGVIWLQGERDANAINDGKMDGEDYEAALRNAEAC